MEISNKLLVLFSKLKYKSGVEIGGPSNIFRTELPIYEIVESLDNINFSSDTIWVKNLQEGRNFEFNQNKTRGYQYIAEASDLRKIENNKYDFIISSHTLEHIANPIKALTEFIRILKKGGYILIIVPDKDYTFDHRRDYTTMDHLILDYQNNVQEGDLTHVEEVLAKHDLALDPPASNFKEFKERSFKNYENRCLHHHVFNEVLLKEMADYLNIRTILTYKFGHLHVLGFFQNKKRNYLREKMNTLLVLFSKAIRILTIYGVREFLKHVYLFIDRRIVFKKLKSLEISCDKERIQKKERDHKHPKILFFSGCDSEAVKRYRIYNTVNLLNFVGIETAVVSNRNIKHVINRLCDFDMAVFSRIGLNEINSQLISILQKNGIPCVFEIDDYLFDEKITIYIDAIRYLNQIEQQQYIDLIKSYKEMLLACDYFLTTTDFLVQRGIEMGKKTYIIRNSLNDRQIEIAEDILKKPDSKNPRAVTLGYFSGSYTHNADFKIIALTLKQIMQKYGRVNLHLGGCISIPSDLQGFKHRIKLIPFTHWEKLPYNIAQIDINLVSLEYTNPFCDGKSEIKYLEAGILGVPTIATATDTHSRIIKQGDNGFIAHNEAEWKKYLMLLIENEGLRKKIGLNARKHILENYTPAAQKDRVKNVFNDVMSEK